MSKNYIFALCLCLLAINCVTHAARSPSKLTKKVLYKTLPGQLAHHRDDILKLNEHKMPDHQGIKKEDVKPKEPETLSKYMQMKQALKKKRERERKHGMHPKGKHHSHYRKGRKEHNIPGHRK